MSQNQTLGSICSDLGPCERYRVLDKALIDLASGQLVTTIRIGNETHVAAIPSESLLMTLRAEAAAMCNRAGGSAPIGRRSLCVEFGEHACVCGCMPCRC